MDPVFHVVLDRPEIPNNTGNIGRTCVATGCMLHLVRPLGFDISAKACRRAGLDYWPRLIVQDHADWAGYAARFPVARRWYFTTKATRPFFAAALRRGDHLVFGRETSGLAPELLATVPSEQQLRLPMIAGERSLNLATAVCTAIFDGVRQLTNTGALRLDQDGNLVVES